MQQLSQIKINNENTCKPVKYKIKCTRSGTNNDSQISNQHEKITNQQRKKNNDTELKKNSKNNVIPYDITTNTKEALKKFKNVVSASLLNKLSFQRTNTPPRTHSSGLLTNSALQLS